ncbi:MAG: M16 family metallopeptidase, partial [Gemmatimonadota bacterium]
MKRNAPRRIVRIAVGAAALLSLPLVGLPPVLSPSAALAQPVEPPPALDARSIEFPAFEEFTLDNGLRVVVLSYGSQPVLSARLYVPGGSALDPAGRAGLADLAASVLTRGTETRTAPEISGTIEGVGGSLSASASQDRLAVSTTVLVEHADTAFELLGDVVLRATFPEDEVELARRRRLSSLQAELGQPQAIAQRHFSRLVYGGEHPYGTSPTPATVQAITRDDLVAFRDRVLRPDGALLLVAGRVERGEVEELVRRHLADWTGGAVRRAELPPVRESGETRIHLVHRPGSSQSVMAVGHPAVEPDHPDRFSLAVMNRVLGGGS